VARLAFLGSPEAAVPSLVSLVDAGHDVALVVSQPDKRRGRGASLAPSPVKRAAIDAGLSVTDDLEDVLEAGVEIAVVVAYGRIVPSRILEKVPMLNAHFSVLPRWRGAAPVERAILAGDASTGVCIMRLEAGLDTGPVLAVRKVPIYNAQREHSSALTERLAVIAAEMLVVTLGEGVAMLGPGKTQVGEATYAAKIESTELMLDFSQTVEHLERVVRLDRAWTTFRGERLRVLDAVGRERPRRKIAGAGAGAGAGPRSGTASGPFVRALEPVSSPAPGTLRDTTVQASDGPLELLIVQPSGRRPQAAAEWVRGARPDADEKLGE